MVCVIDCFPPKIARYIHIIIHSILNEFQILGYTNYANNFGIKCVYKQVFEGENILKIKNILSTTNKSPSNIFWNNSEFPSYYKRYNNLDGNFIFRGTHTHLWVKRKPFINFLFSIISTYCFYEAHSKLHALISAG